MDDSFGLLVSALKKLKSAIISSHVSPDVDAIGSACGLARGLNAAGIPSKVYLQDKVPERYQSLVRDVAVVHAIPEESFSGVIVVDTATVNRVGELYQRVLGLGKLTFNIDHHISNPLYADINFVDQRAASTSQIIFRILRELGAPIDKATAQLLYAGLVDDTGSFRYSNTNIDAFHCAADLLRLGVKPDEIANTLYSSVPERVIQLRAKSLSKMRVVAGGKFALAIVSKALLKECGATSEDSEGIVDEARSIQGVRGAALIRELDSAWKVSLRSKDEKFNVNRVAAQFGGGGHAMAAGCTLIGTIEEVEEQLLKHVEAELGRV